MTGHCTECGRKVIATWAVDGTRRRACLRCLWEALDMARASSLDEILRRLRGRE